jgi:glycosyltransferase involved in cell wall biosynthesis
VARNTGWRAATSEFVTFLDADDRLLPDALRVNLARLRADPDAPFAYGGYVDVDASTGSIEPAAFRPAADGYASFLRENVIGMHATVLYRRRSLDEIGGFRPGLRACEDYDVYLRLSRLHTPAYGDGALAEYWHHDANMSSDEALMLEAVLGVLRGEAGCAAAAGELEAYRAGLRAWKCHYVAQWWRHVADAIRERAVTIRLLRRGASLARRAPLIWLGTPVIRAAERVAQHVRSRLRMSWRRP